MMIRGYLQTTSWTRLAPTEVEVIARTMQEASAGLRAALSSGPKIRTIRLLLDPNGSDLEQWLNSAREAIPEARGVMVQAFLARIFRLAGYDVVVGTKFDIFAKNRSRSLFAEVKSSLNGTKFGSQNEVEQLDRYLIVSERRRAEIWLAIMGLSKPMELRIRFKSELRVRNIGVIDARWVAPDETLPYHFASVG
jgi:Holliday junction resolvase